MRKMFWIDLEMTGLNETTDRILEVAVIITDLDFNVLETYHRIIFQPQEILNSMDEWCKKTHGKSGLTAQIPQGIPIETAEKDLLQIAAKHFPDMKEKIVFCGNSVYMDKRFIDHWMPELSKRTHYRIVDVTSFKEFFRSKYNLEIKKVDKHRAVDDIMESIKEMQHYVSFMNVQRGG